MKKSKIQEKRKDTFYRPRKKVRNQDLDQAFVQEKKTEIITFFYTKIPLCYAGLTERLENVDR